MDVRPENINGEIKRLQQCISDLVSVVALPAIWVGGDTSHVVRTLLDALMRMLRLDFVYVRLSDLADQVPLEMVQVAQSSHMGAPAREIGRMLDQQLGADPRKWVPLWCNPAGDRGIMIVPMQLGVQGEIGVIAAASERREFPAQTERLVLSVAANQAAIGMQEARLLSTQRRLAVELEQRVEQRTKELAEAGHELKKEVVERSAAEKRLREEEAELKRSEARKTAILNSALDCIVTIDHEGRITEFNPAAERTFGYKRDDIVGMRMVDTIVPPLYRQMHQRGFDRYLATGSGSVLGRRIEMTALRGDGSEFPVEIAITRVPLDGPPSFTGYLRDITERKRAEEDLRRSWAFLAEAQHLSSTGSFFWRVETGEVTWSEQLYRIYEFDQDVPVTFERVVTRVHPEDIRSVYDMIARARCAGGDFEFEHRLLMSDRSVKYLHMVAHGSRDQHGQLEYIGAIQDVTERRLSEEALSEVRSELAHMARVMSFGALTASIAHEVNQPLAGIITNASTCKRMLDAYPPNVAGARETLRRTIRDANRASDVIARLRALFGKKDQTIERVDLNEATREVIALSSAELQRSRVILRHEFADDLPSVTGDRVQLQEVILNLLRNASDAMVGVDDRPRHLMIRTERDGDDRVRLTVQDAGVGFDPKEANKLFEAFYSTKSDGMGMGLSVSRSIIESHHGRLWAASNDGPGATFAFSIPRQADRAAGSPNLGSDRTRDATIMGHILRNK